jgi:outer membrane protein TolC
LHGGIRNVGVVVIEQRDQQPLEPFIGNIAESAADVQTNCAKYDLIKITTLNDVASLYVELQDTQARAEYYKTSIQPLTERTETALREAFEDRAVTAYELADLLESLARMKLSDLDLRHQHQRLRTRLELLLECPISSLGGGELPAAPPESIPVPQQVPIPPKIGDQPAS